MENTLEVHAGRVVVRGTPTPDKPEGIFFKPQGFQGWEGIGDGRREQVARALQHGDHDAPTFLPARVVTGDVWIIASKLGELREYSHLLAGLGADGARVPVSVKHQGQTLHAVGRRLSATAEDTGARWRRWYRSSGQFQLVFADPRKRGDANVSPASGVATTANAFQHGNFPAHPVIEIPSGPAAWTVSSPGGTLQVAGATAGGLHRFDMLTGRLTRDGVDMTNAIVRGDVWAVPVGERWQHTLSAPGRVITPTTYV